MLKLFHNAIYLLIAHANHEILREQLSLMIVIASIIKSLCQDDRLTVTLALLRS